MIKIKIALISCSKSKQKYPCIASEMYSESTLFKYSYEYAKINSDKIFILSAKYGLISENKHIEPYDLTLKTMKNEQKIAWSNFVIEQMKKEFDLENDEFIILAGQEYYINFLNNNINYKLPLGNLILGERISFLRNSLNESVINKKLEVPLSRNNTNTNYENKCMKLHTIFNNLRIYNYNQIDEITFENGIYIMFEKGELYNGLNRIVRVGTHNIQGRFKSRLKDHFIKRNKDGSIFRKNIGKALLNKRNDIYLQTWNLDTSKPVNRQFIIREVHKNIEQEVSDYLKNNITFATIRVDDDNLRLRLEKAIIATLNSEETFFSSQSWLGNYSTENEIKESGLWLKIGLNQETINDKEFEFIENNINNIRFVNFVDLNNSSNLTEGINVKKVINENSTLGVKEIKQYMRNIQENQKIIGNHECILISGDIHKQMGLINKMPSVCNAMYNLMKPNDEILRTTNSGKSSTITIKYYL